MGLFRSLIRDRPSIVSRVYGRVRFFSIKSKKGKEEKNLKPDVVQENILKLDISYDSETPHQLSEKIINFFKKDIIPEVNVPVLPAEIKPRISRIVQICWKVDGVTKSINLDMEGKTMYVTGFENKLGHFKFSDYVLCEHESYKDFKFLRYHGGYTGTSSLGEVSKNYQNTTVLNYARTIRHLNRLFEFKQHGRRDDVEVAQALVHMIYLIAEMSRLKAILKHVNGQWCENGGEGGTVFKDKKLVHEWQKISLAIQSCPPNNKRAHEIGIALRTNGWLSPAEKAEEEAKASKWKRRKDHSAASIRNTRRILQHVTVDTQLDTRSEWINCAELLLVNKKKAVRESFCTQSQNQELIVRDGALSPMIDLLKGHKDGYNCQTVNGVIRKTADAITHLAHENSSIKTLVRIKGGIPPLIELLESTDLKVQRAAAGALRTLAFKNAKNKIQIVECNALPGLLQLLRSEDATIHCEAAHIVQRGAVPPLIDMLQSHDVSLFLQGPMLTCLFFDKDTSDRGVEQDIIKHALSAPEGPQIVETHLEFAEAVLGVKTGELVNKMVPVILPKLIVSQHDNDQAVDTLHELAKCLNTDMVPLHRADDRELLFPLRPYHVQTGSDREEIFAAALPALLIPDLPTVSGIADKSEILSSLHIPKERAISNIEAKLRGVVGVGAAAPSLPLAVEGQARCLIAEDASHNNLGKMYSWWLPWF